MKTYFRTLFIVLLLLFIYSTELAAQDYTWARSKNSSEGISISVNANGNSYETGYFQGTVSFGTFNLTSFGSYDIFITKFDSAGNCVWAKQAGGSDFDCGKGISVDHEGNICIIGTFRGTAFFGTNQLNSYGSDDIFLAKYDPDGNCLWAQKAGGKNQDDCLGIFIDERSNSYITGYFQDTASFGSTQLISIGTREVYIAKYDTHGKCLWAAQNDGGNSGTGLSISVDGNKNIYITGNFQGPAKFGKTQLNSLGKSDIFISKYDSYGNCLWAQKAGGPNQDYGYGIATDENGSSYVAGLFEGPAQFGLKQLTGLGIADIFIAKYDTHGNCIWANQAGSSTAEFARGISIDSKGNSYITGSFSGDAVFDTIHLTGLGGIEIFIAEYDKDGNCLWAKPAGGSNNNWGNSITIDSRGNSYITGRFQGLATFGTFQLSGNSKFDTFVAKYDPLGKCLWVKQSNVNKSK
jgi:hypothetical protein